MNGVKLQEADYGEKLSILPEWDSEFLKYRSVG